MDLPTRASYQFSASLNRAIYRDTERMSTIYQLSGLLSYRTLRQVLAPPFRVLAATLQSIKLLAFFVASTDTVAVTFS